MKNAGVHRISGRSRQILAAIAGIATLACGYEGAAKWKMHVAKQYLSRGFPSLAAAEIDFFRGRFVGEIAGCDILIEIYSRTRSTERLEWAAEACAAAGDVNVRVATAFATVQELQGNDAEALSILRQTTVKFDGAALPFYQMASILKRNLRTSEAVEAYINAFRAAPDNVALGFETMGYLFNLKKLAEAGQIAGKIKDAPGQTAEFKLMVGRVLLESGDKAAAKKLAEQAKQLLAGTADEKKIEILYDDVLRGEPPPPQEAPRAPASNDPGKKR
jgi:tetratricopeptide (TPR) repeat protein